MAARRYAILTEGQLVDRRAKTAHGVIQYGRDEIAAVIDSRYAGRDVADVLPRLHRSAPIVASLRESLAYRPTSLLLGVANQGGFIPDDFRPHILAAIDAGLEIVSGLHQLLRDRSEFVATGQTGTLIAGKGIVVDRAISDFITGAAEQLVLGVARDARYALVEGQGSLWHPAYAPVTVGLLYGCAPDVLVMCIDTEREAVEEYGVTLPALPDMIAAHEALLAPIKAASVAVVAVNTSSLDDAQARAAIAQAEASSGLPADDVVRYGGARLWNALRDAAQRTG